MITPKQLKELENKLIAENRSSNYLNTCLSRDGKSKVDIFSIQTLLELTNQNLVQILFKEQSQLTIKPNNTSVENIVIYHKLLENLNGIIQKQTQIYRNRGIKSLKIGYPLIAFQTKTSQSECFLAPIFLIDIYVKAESRGIEIKVINEITINPNLITAVQSNNIPLSFRDTIAGIGENIRTFELIAKFINENSNHLNNVFSDNLQKIPFQRKPELYSDAEEFPKLSIYNSGILSNFVGSNIGIINDLQSYESGIEDVRPFNFKIRSFPIQKLDPSQLNVIESINKNKHLIIHGPPGTGKSQTITGIITSALAQKKTVLVVCEKRAALDVIHSNLSKEEIETYVRTITNIDTDQHRIIKEIRDLGDRLRIQNSSNNINENEINQSEQYLTQRVQELVKSKSALYWNIIPKHKWKDLVGRRIKTREYSEIEVPDNIIRTWEKNLESTIENCIKATNLSSSISKHEFLKEHINFQLSSNDIITNIDIIKKLLDQSNHLIEQQIETENNINQIIYTELNNLTYKVTTLNNELSDLNSIAEKIQSICLENFPSQVKLKTIKLNNLETFILTIEKLENTFKNAANCFFELPPDFFVSKKINFIKFLTDKKYRINLNKYKIISKLTHGKTSETTIEYIYKLIQKTQELLVILKELKIKCENNYEYYCIQLNKQIFENQILISKINSFINSGEQVSFDTIKKLINNEEINKIQNIKNEIKRIDNQIIENQVLNEQLRTTFSNNRQNFEIQLNSLQNSLTDIINYSEFRSIAHLVFDNAELHPKIDCLGLFYNKLSQFKLNELYLTNTSLTTNKEDLINYIRVQSENAQNNTKELAKKFLNDSFSQGMANTTNFSTIFALRGQNRKSLKEICNNHLEIFTNCCPVLLTTPDIVSTLFTGKSDVYDLIIFDEASQIEIHNSIGAFQKGKVKIVAGDQHQMPPSSYFLKRSNIENFEIEELDDETNEQGQQAFIDVESLLDFCISNQTEQFESKYLDFHYRSENPALIRFSNDAIYKRLVIKPTDLDYKPFEFVHQSNGIWENSENYSEATRVIEIISEIKLTNDHVPLVLVGTLNINQANLISKLLTTKRIADPLFEDRFSKLERAGFAVVNLENLQGDECDIMILSTGYGPNNDGTFRSQFIFSGAKGYRLLNVAITRARYKNILVTSIPKSVYKNYLHYLSNEEINPKTKGLFYAYINYVEAYASNKYAEVDSICDNIRKYFLPNNNFIEKDEDQFESPFEEEVYDVLRTRFSSSEITLQENHGESGFRIDMVIRPIQCPSLKIAIECDGATYHNGWSNQILDSHRQNLLEKANYKFIRIWSTDWWQNYEGAKMVLFSKINELLDNYSAQQSETIQWLNNIISTTEPTNQEISEFQDEIDLLEDDDNEDIEIITQNSIITREISRSCSVKLRVNGTDERFFSISDYHTNVNNSQNSGVLNADTPLARLLFGKKEGDTIRFNNNTYIVLEII
jgi:very-short-patch-repair endonuclease